MHLAAAEVPIIVFMVDPSGTLTFVEGRGLERTGVSPDEIVGRSAFELGEGVPLAAASVRRALSGEPVRDACAAGSATYDVQYVPLRDDAGAVTGVLGWGLDVSDCARAEEQQALLARAVDQTTDGVFVSDASGVIRYVNAAYERLTGDRAAEIVGRPAALFHIARSNPELHREIAETLQRDATWEGPLAGLRRDEGEDPIRASFSNVRDGSGRVAGTVCVASHVSDVTRLQRRLERAQRLESIGRLAGGVAHDFNNLLTAILGYAELCAAEVGPGGVVAEGLAEIREAAERGARLTGQLLAFSRSQPMRREPIVLNELLRSLEGVLRRIIPEGVELRVQCDDDAGVTLGDRGQIEQVVLNLVVNAIDAMPTGGVLTLSSGEAADEGGPGRDSSRGFAVVGVRDTGVGMDDAQMERIFEPFYTTKAIGQCSGLGLATVHGTVERCGGHVSVRSQPGSGTEVRVYLPKTADPAEAPALTPDSAAPDSRRKTILYVEDDSRVRAAVERMLRSLGYSTFVAKDAESAITMVRTNAASIDLLLTDVRMPGRSGIDLAVDVRHLAPGARVLFVSGHADSALQPQMLEETGVGFLAKPFQTAALSRALRDLLDQPTLRS